MGEPVKLRNKGEAEAKIRELAVKGDREHAQRLAWVWGIKREDVDQLFDERAEALSKKPEIQPGVVKPKIEIAQPVFKRRIGALAQPKNPQPEEERKKVAVIEHEEIARLEGKRNP